MKKRILCLCLALTMALGCLPAFAAFGGFSDVQNHWAANYLEQAYNDGLLKGYDDNTMRPDTAITGAQMVTILSRVLGLQQEADISAQLSNKVWYYESAAKAVALGLIQPSELSSLDKAMTRQKAFCILAEAFQLGRTSADLSVLNGFSDASQLSVSEKTIWASLIQAGYVNGWDGTLMLQNNVRRAEFIALLYRVAGRYLSAADYTPASLGTVVSGDLNLTASFGENLWTGAAGTRVFLEDVTGGSLTLRNDKFADLELGKSKLTTLVLASRGGDINLFNTLQLDTLVVGSGTGNVTVGCTLNTLDVRGTNRTVTISSPTEALYVDGSGNTVTVTGKVGQLVVKGSNNRVILNSSADSLDISGSENTVSGTGMVTNATQRGTTNNITVSTGTLTDLRDAGITGAALSIIDLPNPLAAGATLTAGVSAPLLPAGKTVTGIWYVNGKEVSRKSFTTGAAVTIPRLSYKFTYTENMALTAKVGYTMQYTTNNGDAQSISAPEQTITLKNYDYSHYHPVQKPTTAEVLAKVTSTYSGNYTTQWAINHDLTTEEKTIFVNAKGYSSSTAYLAWINRGTQHVSIFMGKQGNWTLVKSFLCGTGAASTPTPVGIYTVWARSAAGWTTSTYNVRPVVNFKVGSGLAFHSRLYNPGHNYLTDASIGFPISHGCIRMYDADVQWIYDYVPNNTTVVVY